MDCTNIFEKEIVDVLSNYPLEYVKINDPKTLISVRNLFVNNIQDISNNDDMYLFYLAVYHSYVLDDNDKAKEYYLMSIEYKNIYSMYNLAFLYEEEKDYLLAEKYYLMAIENGLKYSIYKLARLYMKTLRFDEGVEYLKRAANENIVESYYHLANYYLMINRKIAEEYYIMGARCYNVDCIKKINEMLLTEFDIKFAIRSVDFLDNINLEKLNEIICEVIKFKRKKSFITDKFPCVKCKEVKLVIFKKCGHSICIECFVVNEPCYLCGR